MKNTFIKDTVSGLLLLGGPMDSCFFLSGCCRPLRIDDFVRNLRKKERVSRIGLKKRKGNRREKEEKGL